LAVFLLISRHIREALKQVSRPWERRKPNRRRNLVRKLRLSFELHRCPATQSLYIGLLWRLQKSFQNITSHSFCPIVHLFLSWLWYAAVPGVVILWSSWKFVNSFPQKFEKSLTPSIVVHGMFWSLAGNNQQRCCQRRTPSVRLRSYCYLTNHRADMKIWRHTFFQPDNDFLLAFHVIFEFVQVVLLLLWSSPIIYSD
jgi:hypothetical protein